MISNFRKILPNALFWVIVLSISFYFYYENLLPYFQNGLDNHQKSEKWWLIAHFSGAACTLFLGPLQFWAYFRNHFGKWHRIAGKVYIVGSVFSALIVFYLPFFPQRKTPQMKKNRKVLQFFL